MRKDMKRVIIDIGRYADASVSAYASGIRSRNRQQLRRDPEVSPECEGMSRPLRGGNRWFGDRVRPLERALRKQVGRPWDVVWSEVCRRNDGRSLDGWHLRVHVRDLVLTESDPPQGRFRDPKPFLVDGHGILRRNPAHRPGRKHLWRRLRGEPRVGSTHLRLESGTCVQKIDGFWYELEWIEHESLHLWDGEHRRRSKRSPTTDDPLRLRKRRLSNRDVKRLRLEERAQAQGAR